MDTRKSLSYLYSKRHCKGHLHTDMPARTLRNSTASRAVKGKWRGLLPPGWASLPGCSTPWQSLSFLGTLGCRFSLLLSAENTAVAPQPVTGCSHWPLFSEFSHYRKQLWGRGKWGRRGSPTTHFWHDLGQITQYFCWFIATYHV